MAKVYSTALSQRIRML
jgi:hypothetical protein